jgi:hypothetical protein
LIYRLTAKVSQLSTCSARIAHPTGKLFRKRWHSEPLGAPRKIYQVYSISEGGISDPYRTTRPNRQGLSNPVGAICQQNEFDN